MKKINKDILKVMSNRICKLCCIENSHEPIILPHKQEIFVGRTPKTNIRVVEMSRKQVKLVADLENLKVKVIPLGVNPAGANGFKLEKNVEYTLKHKDRLELLLDKFVHEIQFDPPPNDFENDKTIIDSKVNVNQNKRKTLDSSPLENDKKKIKKVVRQDENTWEEIDNKNLYIFTSKGVESREKIAAYDIDGTIVTTKSGARFPKDALDYKILFPEVPKKLKEMYKNGYKIVFFTNQAGIATGKTSLSFIKQKVEGIVKDLGIPLQVFVAPTRSIYRKPAPGMWNTFSKEKNDGIEVDFENSFYVGDAAGRKENWAPKKKKDHSFADRLFALNVGLPFFTPEEHFLRARKVPFAMPEFDPRNIDKDYVKICENEDKLVSDKQEVVVMVGGPGSGKSFVCNEYLKPNGYVHVNRDTLGSWQKCVLALEKHLSTNQSVVIDNTNPDAESRKRYIDVAKKYKIPIRCFVMTTSIHQAKHNNFFREITDKNHQKINDIIINSYKKNFKEPELSEGFSEILEINCVPKFKDSELKKLYHMFLLDK